jgi:uncharacterized repeat protein (TIGR01451 family)
MFIRLFAKRNRFIFALTLVLLLIGTLLINGFLSKEVQAVNVQYRVSASADDAEESEAGVEDGQMGISNNKLRFGKASGEHHVGMRFTGVVIPAEAIIDSAYITFVANNNDSGSFQGDFYGEDSATPATFVSSTHNITNRTTTTAKVKANSGDFGAWTSGSSYDSPDIVSIIRELYVSYDYSTGGDIVIVWYYKTGNGERIAKTYDKNANKAPVLVINYTLPDFSTSQKVDDDADNSVTPGQSVRYTVSVTNSALPTSTGVTLTDVIDDNFGIPYAVSSTNCGTPLLSFVAPTATFSGIDVNPMSTCLLSYAVDVDSVIFDEDPDNETIENSATLDPVYGSGVLQADTLTLDVTPVFTSSTKVDNDLDNYVLAGQPVTYTVTLRNIGDGTATGVNVDDNLNAAFENLSVTSLANCGASSTDVSTPTKLDIQDLIIEPGTDCTIIFAMDVRADASVGTSITNSVTVYAANEGGSGATLGSDVLTVSTVPESAPPPGGGGAALCTAASGSFTINGGATSTDSREVIVQLDYANVNEMMVSEDPNFVGVVYVPVASEYPLLLSEVGGVKTVYVRFKNGCSYSAVYSQEILHTGDGTDFVTEEFGDRDYLGVPQSGICEINCDDVEIDLYLINPDGNERRVGSEFVKVEEMDNGALRYSYEDKGFDFDFDDFVVDIFRKDCTRIIVRPVSINAGWHHQARIVFTYGGQSQDILLWPDTHKTVAIAFDVNNYPELCPIKVHASKLIDFTQAMEIFDESALSYGANGEEVVNLQRSLQALGYFPAHMSPSGYFGAITWRALRAFQVQNGIDGVGYVGPKTRNLLNGFYINSIRTEIYI